MSAPRSVSVLTSESLVWGKANHQPSTKPHIWYGNRAYEAEAQEVSGCNASEGIEHRNNHRFGGRYCSFSSRQNSYNRIWQGNKSPTVSKTTARYHKELR